MALTKTQEVITAGLGICGVSLPIAWAILHIIRSKDQEYQMTQYLMSIVENPPSEQAILTKAAEIAGLMNEQPEDLPPEERRMTEEEYRELMAK